MKEISALFLFLYLITVIYSIHAEDTRTCILGDTACLKKQSENILLAQLPDLIKKMNEITVDVVINDVDNFYFNWTDVKVTGLNDSVFDDIKINMDLKVIRILFHTNMNMDFNYLMQGSVLSLLPIYGSGKGRLELKHMKMEILFLFDIEKDGNGMNFINLKKYYYGYDTVDGIYATFHNLYDDDKEKSDLFHRLANESWMIMKENFAESFQKKITNKIFERVKTYFHAHPLQELALY